MSLPPAWKIKRELFRLDHQFRSLVEPVGAASRRLLYDTQKSASIDQLNGDLPVGEKIAVFVLFQPSGVAESVLRTLDTLIAAHWTPVIVSNAPLSPECWNQLREKTALALVRKNRGYDFGAYRDGLNLLTENSIEPAKLILMNDSTWFPLFEGDDVLERLEAKQTDFAGHIFKIEDINNRARDHMESHFVMIGPRLLSSDAFKQFWKNYTMSDSRDRTIEIGEKGLSQLVVHSEFEHDPLLSRRKLVDLLRGLSDEDLVDVFENLVHHLDDAKAEVDAILKSVPSAGWRERLCDWAFHELSHSLQHLLSVTFLYPAVKYGGLSYIKKSSERRFHLARQKLLQLEADGKIRPLDSVVRQEIEQAIEVWVPPYEWRGEALKHQSG